MSERVKLQAADGFEFEAYVAKPEGTPKAAMVVIQEIFGVNTHIRAVADSYAAEGYLAVAPALFDRYERGFEVGYDGEGWQKGMEKAQKLNFDWIGADTLAAVEYARKSQGGKVGIVGYCLGGSVAWMAAAQMPVDAAVGYYGGNISKMNAMQPKVPTLLHFGAKDDHIPHSDIDAIKAAHPDVPVYLYDAGHGFNCDLRDSYDKASADEARERTLAFFAKNL
jgi:carboxymethylenebutenolidase